MGKGKICGSWRLGKSWSTGKQELAPDRMHDVKRSTGLELRAGLDVAEAGLLGSCRSRVCLVEAVGRESVGAISLCVHGVSSRLAAAEEVQGMREVVPSKGGGMRRGFVRYREPSWSIGKEEGSRHTRHVVRDGLCGEATCRNMPARCWNMHGRKGRPVLRGLMGETGEAGLLCWC